MLTRCLPASSALPRPRWRFLGPGFAFLASALAALFLAACGGEPASTQSGGRSAQIRGWVIRHAEKDLTPGVPDAALTEAGLARAAAWAERFRAEPLAAVLCTKWRRSRETAGPIASAHGIEPTIVDADAGAAASAVRALLPGSRVVIVGHSNTIPPILDALGAGVPGLTISEDEYGGVWEVSVAPASVPEAPTSH